MSRSNLILSHHIENVCWISKDTCPKGGKHKYITDEESGEIIVSEMWQCREIRILIFLNTRTDQKQSDGKKFELGSFVGQTKNDRKKVKKKLPYLEKYDENLDQRK